MTDQNDSYFVHNTNLRKVSATNISNGYKTFTCATKFLISDSELDY